MILVRMIGQGFVQTIRAWRAVLLLWAVNLVLAFAVASLVRSMWMSVANASSFGERLLSGFDFSVVTEMLRKGSSLSSGASAGLFWMVLLNLVAVSLFAGGVVKALKDNDPVLSIARICSEGGRFAGRMLRLLLLQIVALLLLVGAGFTLGSWLIASAVQDARAETAVLSMLYPAAGAVFLPAYIVFGLFSYARTMLVLSDERSVFRAIGKGAKVFTLNLPSILAFHALLLLATLVLIWIHWLIDDRLMIESLWSGIEFMLILQVVVVCRMLFKLWDYSAAVILITERILVVRTSQSGEIIPALTRDLEAESVPQMLQKELVETPSGDVVEKSSAAADEDIVPPKRKGPVKHRVKSTMVPKRLPNKRKRR
jgi:hypothetical protein